MTVTEDLEYEIDIGFSHNVTKENKYTETYDLTLQMTEGIKFEVVNESETLTEEYSTSIMSDTKTSMTYDLNKTFKTKCSAQQGSSGVGLWQWVVRNGKSNVDTFVGS